MCGILGVFNIDQKPVSNAFLKKMLQVISHRGPDGEGYYISENIGLAHKRLAILDTSSRANQPMVSKSEKWIVVFNGCIYNFRELRQQLQSRGHVFTTTSDTEVIAEGLDEFGPEYFHRLNGMFAIGAWNTREKKLYLSRDRFGVKPLYFWFNGKTIVFSSEIKAILEHPDYNLRLNHEALNEYFTFQNVFSYITLFEGIESLPAANTICIDKNTDRIIHNAWWDYSFKEDKSLNNEKEVIEETNRLFTRAVARQMVSDVPVGSYLSGGMDSGSITAIASSQVQRLATFTCGFDMSEVTGVEVNYDERRDAELIANHFKTEHYEQIINAGDLKWSLPKVVYHLEDLRVGMSYPNYYISRLASKFVKVCLQGTGGDELFGGYPWRYYRVFDSVSKQNYLDQYYNFWQRLVKENEKKDLFNADVMSKITLDRPRSIFERVFNFNTDLKYDSPEEHINNSLYFEIKTFLPGLLLVGDKLSMANGLEERFPFLDNDLVDFAQRIPVEFKLGNLKDEIKRLDENLPMKKKAYREFVDGKNILRKAMLDLIPSTILNRKKQGFSAPDESWYRGENANYIKELLLDKRTVSSEFINPEFIKKVVNEHIDKHINHRLLIWSFMNFEWWCRIFLNGDRKTHLQ